MLWMKRGLAKYSLMSGVILFIAAVTVATLVTFDRNKSEDLFGSPVGSGKVSNVAEHEIREMPPVTPQTASHSDKTNDEVAKIKKQQLELSRKLKLLESNVKEIQTDSALQNQVEDSEIPMDPETLREKQEAREAIMDAQMQAQLDLFDNTLDKETPDPLWSVEAVSALEDRITQDKALKVDLRTVQCGNSLCRIELIVPHGQNYENLHHRFADLIPWNSEAFYRIDTSERGEVTIYVARENHSLPRISN